jgi:hypothetical protein
LWGLPGAALTVAAAMLLDQILFLFRTMRHLSLTATALLASIWRPVAASAVMVAVLESLGLAWTPGGAEGWSNFPDLLARCVLGAAVYAAALLSIWLLAGRPDGVERKTMAVVLGRLRPRVAR